MVEPKVSKGNNSTLVKEVLKTSKRTKQKKSIQEKKEDNLEEIPSDMNFLNDIMMWLQQIIIKRCKEIDSDIRSESVWSIQPLPQTESEAPYAKTTTQYHLNEVGHILLALAIAPHYAPEIFDQILRTRNEHGHLKPHVGGQLDTNNNTFIPTYFTALFLLSGNNLQLRSQYISQLQESHPLLQKQILYKGDQNGTITHFMQSIIELDTSFYDYFTKGIQPRLDHGQHFAATLHTTHLTRDDIILEDKVAEEIMSIDNYAEVSQSGFFERADHKFKKGFIALFYGSPGTGKTLLAGILANSYNMDMYHVDLSNVVSRYVGEAEKKLEIIFNRLQGENCILFFDEADALFGKRSEVKEAHDRYANQEVSYLLQRIEKFDGLVILASNFKNNMDDAFKRRMDVTVNVIRPKEKSRKALWNYYLPKNLQFEDDTLLTYLVEKFAYTGANIRNVMKNVAIDMEKRKETIITHQYMTPFLTIENEKAFGANQSRVQPMNPNRR